mgnify:CR=1 FL=1
MIELLADPQAWLAFLTLTALGAPPAQARDRAYDAASLIEFDGMQMRTDIAARAVDRVPS